MTVKRAPARPSRTWRVVAATLLVVASVAVLAGPASARPATALDGIDAGVSDSIVRLYRSVFDRAPDRDGLRYWVGRYAGGVPLDVIAGSFMASAEWQRRYGDVGDEAFVDLLYRNVLHRPPDTAGRRYWLGVVEGPSAPTRPELLVFFSESREFVARTGTASPTPPPSPFPPPPPGSGRGRRIVYGNRAQRVWLINADGSIHDSYAVSGRRNSPAPGVYSVFSKSPVAWAGHDGITMKHMVRFARGRRLAIGFHSIPTYRSGRPLQRLDQLGTYRSAGCVRQAPHQAEALYDWADIGTRVVVLA